MLIDDWAPGREDWFDAEPSSWHYEHGDEKFPGLEESVRGDHVLQILSDATGDSISSLCRVPSSLPSFAQDR